MKERRTNKSFYRDNNDCVPKILNRNQYFYDWTLGYWCLEVSWTENSLIKFFVEYSNIGWEIWRSLILSDSLRQPDHNSGRVCMTNENDKIAWPFF